MRIGKLTDKELKDSVIDVLGNRRSEVVLSAGIARDCAAVRCEDIILLTSDPITAASREAGRLAVIVSVNDIAAGGGEPFCCMTTILAPVGSTAEDIRSVMIEIERQAEILNVAVVGGHTEFTPHVDKIIVSCTMLGRTKKLYDKPLKAGDSIVMTKYAGIEGTFIAVTDGGEERLGLTEEERNQALALSDKLCVLGESVIAVRLGYSHMHDATEGGILGAALEVCRAEGVGARLFADKIPVLPVTRKIAGVLNIDPLRLISSGSMLIFTDKPSKLIAELKENGIPAVKIGEIESTKDVRLFQNNGESIIIDTEEDEIHKL